MDFDPERLYPQVMEGLIELLERDEQPHSPWIPDLREDLEQWNHHHQVGRTIFIGNMGGFLDWNSRDPWVNGAFDGLLAAAYMAIDGITRRRPLVGEAGGFRFENLLGSTRCARCQRQFVYTEVVARTAGEAWARRRVRLLLIQKGPSRLVDRAFSGHSDPDCQQELRSLEESAHAVGLEIVDYNPHFDVQCRACGGPWIGEAWDVFPEPPRLRPRPIDQ